MKISGSTRFPLSNVNNTIEFSLTLNVENQP